MKAFVVYDKWRDELYATVVFAENRNQARYIALSTDTCDGGAYCDIVAHRLPIADLQYKGRTEMDWLDPEDRLFLVKECDFRCIDPEFDKCESCIAKEYCGEYEYLAEEYNAELEEDNVQ